MLDNFNVRTKMLILSLIMLITMIIIVTSAVHSELLIDRKTVSSMEKTIRNNYDTNIKNQVESVITMLDEINKKYELGEYSLNQAKKDAADLVRNLRYNSDGYFWIDTVDGTNVVLLGSNVEGTNRYNYKDVKGDFVVQKIIVNSMKKDGGYTDYWFPKIKGEKPYPKRAYSKYFKPFNWVIGTGNYVDGIDNIIAKKKAEFNKDLIRSIVFFSIISAFFVLLMILVTIIISINITIPLECAVEHAKKISAGNLTVKVPEMYKKRKDEVGHLSNALEKMQISLRKLFEDIKEKTTVIEISEIRHKALVNANPDMMFVFSGDGNILDYKIENTDIASQIDSKICIGDNIDNIFSKNVSELIKDRINIIKSNGETQTYEYSLNNGKVTYYESRLVLYSENSYLAIVRDITERKLLEKALHEEKELLKMTLISVGDGVISTDEKGNVRLINEVAENLIGWKQDEAFGRPFEEVFNIINDKTKDKFDSPVNMVFSTGKIIELPEGTVLISKTGKYIPIEDSAAPIKDVNGKITGVVLVFRDATEKKRKQERIEYLSFHDQLTGLYNRRFYDEETARMDTSRNYPLSIIVADVNGLKLANDAFGHLIGDELIRKAAETLKKEFRSDDIIARVGGDEFVILLPKTELSVAEQLLERIKKAEATEKVGPIKLSISFGCAAKCTLDITMDEIFKSAEDNMYKQKLAESQSIRMKIINDIISSKYDGCEADKKRSKKTSELCGKIGEKLGLSVNDIEELKTAGLLHDIGNVTFDEEILRKPQELSEYESAVMKHHTEAGYQILRSVNEMARVAEYVLAHHERWDGKGYPRGLNGDNIPLQSRIISVADAFYAMTSDRLYRKTLSKEEAINEIKNNAGTQFDPYISEILIKIQEEINI